MCILRVHTMIYHFPFGLGGIILWTLSINDTFQSCHLQEIVPIGPLVIRAQSRAEKDVVARSTSYNN